jgi:Pyruvate/2-oxoacid:ferredoxin oxidoreductase delta subunit
MTEGRDRREPSLLPAIDQALCNGCGICIARCPTAALLEPMNASCSKCVKYCTTMEVPCCPTRLVLVDGLCNGCGLCATACPLHAISMIADSNVPKSAAAG